MLPLHGSKLPWPYKKQWRTCKRGAYHVGALLPIDVAQQFGDLPGVGKRREVVLPRSWWECTAQVNRGVMLRARCGYRVTENASAAGKHAVRRFKRTPCLDAPNNL